MMSAGSVNTKVNTVKSRKRMDLRRGRRRRDGGEEEGSIKVSVSILGNNERNSYILHLSELRTSNTNSHKRVLIPGTAESEPRHVTGAPACPPPRPCPATPQLLPAGVKSAAGYKKDTGTHAATTRQFTNLAIYL